jgi:protein TonB
MKRLLIFIFLIGSIYTARAQEIGYADQNQRADSGLVFAAVQVQPHYSSGLFTDYIKANQNTPSDVADKPARIIVQFIVEKDGSLSNIKILRSPSDMDSAEAMRLMKKSPKWSPGIQNGKAVRCYFTVPISLGGNK